MTRVVSIQTNFTSGELDPLLLGRVDLRAHRDGARKLRNVLIHPTGGISRRPGTTILHSVDRSARIIPFRAMSRDIIIALSADHLTIFEENGTVLLDSIWTETQIRQLDWIRFGNSILICHPDIRPQRLERSGALDWRMGGWDFEALDTDYGAAVPQVPWFKFAQADVSLRVFRDGAAEGDPALRGQNVVVVTSQPVFGQEHYGSAIRVKGRVVLLRGFLDEQTAHGIAVEDLLDDRPTMDWQEAVFSTPRGWPRALALYQDRLVLGGSRELGNHVWMSKTGSPFNFNVGIGLDDESIAFRISANSNHEIVGISPGRVLQILTTEGEWTVKGHPLTPMSIEIDPQTKIGSRSDTIVKPVDVDGATLFVGRSGNDLREFLFTDTEQAYQAADIATLSRHLLIEPVEMLFDGSRRVLFIVRADGAVAVVTIDRPNNVVAWSLLELVGKVRSIALIEDRTYLLVERNSQWTVEVLDAQHHLDHATVFEQISLPLQQIDGLDRYVGNVVAVLADRSKFLNVLLTESTINLPAPAERVVVGLPYAHEVEPMPPALSNSRDGSLISPYRPIQSVLRTIDTEAVTLNTGSGARVLTKPSNSHAPDDFTVRCIGWRRGVNSFPWKIRDDKPSDFTLLAVHTEYKVN